MAIDDPAQQNIQDTAASLKAGQAAAARSAQNQQEANKAFKESINLLTKMNRLIDDSASKTASFEKTTINVKKIEQERERIEGKRKTLFKEIQRYQQADVDSAKEYLSKIEQREELEKKLSRTIGLQKLSIQQQLTTLNKTIDTKEAQLANSKEQLELVSKIRSEEGLKERIEGLNEELAVEEKIADQVGFTGSLLKQIGRFYPKAGELYKKIVGETREGVSTTSNWVKGITIFGAALAGLYKIAEKSFNAISSGITSLTGSGGPMSKFVSPFTDLVKQIPMVGGLLGGIIDLGANLIDFATGANSEIQKFARNLGISVDVAKKLNDEYDSISRNTESAYLNAEKFRKAQTELSAALGINNIFTKEILAADIRLAEQAGIELDTRKELASVALITGKLQTQIFGTIAAQTKILNDELGVSIRLQDTIKKAASFGGILGLTFAKYPEKLTKTLLVTKALGMDLQKIDGIAGGLLDFESSIAKEFEAQLLTGKDINLQKAREYALNNDLLGVANEINKVAGSTEEFLNMNRLEQESIAQSIGMSRDELADVLKQQALFAAAGAKTEKQFKENIKLMQQRGTLESEFLSKLSDTESQLFLNSTATETIANFIDKIKQSFANLLNTPTFQTFIDNVMTALKDPNFINNIVDKLANFSNFIVKITATLLKAMGYLVHAADYITFGAVIPNEIPQTLIRLGENMSTYEIGGKVARSQANASGNSYGPSTQGNASQQSLNLNVTTYTVDTPRETEVKMNKPPGIEVRTGPYR
jgi:hypothetical protein